MPYNKTNIVPKHQTAINQHSSQIKICPFMDNCPVLVLRFSELSTFKRELLHHNNSRLRLFYAHVMQSRFFCVFLRIICRQK